jgi:hypothetical protein
MSKTDGVRRLLIALSLFSFNRLMVIIPGRQRYRTGKSGFADFANSHNSDAFFVDTIIS